MPRRLVALCIAVVSGFLPGACNGTHASSKQRFDSVAPSTDTRESSDSPIPVDSHSEPDGPDSQPIESVPGETSSGWTDTATEDIGGTECPNLPVLFIDTSGASITSDTKIDASLEVVTCYEGDLEEADSAPRSFSGPIGIEIHGSSSAGYPKLSYRFETRDDEGDDLEVGLLDLPHGSDWVLYAPYSDKTLVRNAMAFQLGEALAEGSGRWEPRVRFLELYLNGEYEGVYLLIEHVDRDGDRIDIPVVADSADDGDLTGGYIVVVDQHRNPGWNSHHGTPIDYHYPRNEDITHDQGVYIRTWFDSFEDMLSASDFEDPTSGWPAWIDVDSWIDHYIVNELCANVDAYRLSAYLYKQADADGGLLFAGPLWDLDRAWGNVYYCYCEDTAGFVEDDLGDCGYAYQFPFWWSRLREDDAFTSATRCRWESLREDVLSDKALLARMDDLANEVADAERRDNDRWGNVGVWIDPNYYVGATWEDELAWMQAWIVDRTAWLDANIAGTCDGGAR
jgi:hypothetical protein